MSQHAFGAFDDAAAAASAFLSNATWSDTLGQKTLQTYLDSSNTGWKKQDIPNSYFPAAPSYDSKGYYTKNNVVAFAATKGDTLAVSIRGIAGLSDVKGEWSATV